MSLAILNMEGWLYFLRWMHYFFGIIWIGHLYYFNFTQMPFMAETDASTKTGVTLKLVPRALWWFRWGAMFTFITGLLILMGRLHQNPNALSTGWGVGITTGASLAIVMWANVWFVIWPKQKVIIANAEAVAAGKPANPAAAALAPQAALASRSNVLFSIPMLFFMGAGRYIPFEVTSTGTYYVAFFILLALLEFNALKGKKLGPLTTVKGVVHCGLALAVVLYFMMEFLTKM